MARRKAVPIASHNVCLSTIPVPQEADHGAIGLKLVGSLSSLQQSDLAKDAHWRDLLSLTGTFRAFHSSSNIIVAWAKLSKQHGAPGFQIQPNSTQIDGNVIRAGFTFRTSLPRNRPASCSGFINITLDEQREWKIWVLSTMIEQVESWPDPDILKSNNWAPRMLKTDRESALAVAKKRGEQRIAELDKVDFDCVVVGAGMSGLCILGRLAVLGVSAIGIERNAIVGQNTHAPLLPLGSRMGETDKAPR